MLDRTVAPQHHVISSVSFDKATSGTLSGGTPFHHLINGNQPVVKIEVLFPWSGSWYEHKRGVAFLSLKTLREGTSSFSSEHIDDLLSGHGAFLDIHPGFDFASLSLHCLDKHVENLLPVLAEMVDAPAFAEDEVVFQKKQHKAQLQLQDKRNTIRASRKLRTELFGNLHPYGRVVNIEDVDHIAADDLRHFHQHQMQDVEIFVSGGISDYSLKQVRSYFEQRAFARRDREAGYLEEQQKAINLNKAEQTSIRLGKEVIKKSHSDYLSLLITNHLLGGFFGSRLMKNIREDKGLTYGINSSLVNLTHSTYWVLGAEVNERLTEEALSEVRKEIDDLREFNDDEQLNIVKAHMTGSFQSEVNTPYQLMEKFKNIYLHGLDYDYYDAFFSRIKEFTCEDVRDTAAQYLRTDEIKEVVVR